MYVGRKKKWCFNTWLLLAAASSRKVSPSGCNLGASACTTVAPCGIHGDPPTEADRLIGPYSESRLRSTPQQTKSGSPTPRNANEYSTHTANKVHHTTHAVPGQQRVYSTANRGASITIRTFRTSHREKKAIKARALSSRRHEERERSEEHKIKEVGTTPFVRPAINCHQLHIFANCCLSKNVAAPPPPFPHGLLT